MSINPNFDILRACLCLKKPIYELDFVSFFFVILLPQKYKFLLISIKTVQKCDLQLVMQCRSIIFVHIATFNPPAQIHTPHQS